MKRNLTYQNRKDNYIKMVQVKRLLVIPYEHFSEFMNDH